MELSNHQKSKIINLRFYGKSIEFISKQVHVGECDIEQFLTGLNLRTCTPHDPIQLLSERVKQYKRYCKDPINGIEGYEKFIKDPEKYHIHHRLEDQGYTSLDLKSMEMYYNRPACELIFMERHEHMKHHANIRKTIKRPVLPI